MATVADLLIKLGIDNRASAGLQKFEKDADSAGEHTKSFSGTMGEASESIQSHIGKVVAAAGIMGGAFEAGEFLKGGIESAEALEKAQESLEGAIKSTGGSVEELKPQFDQVAKSAAQYGVTQTDAEQAMSRAVLLTGNATAGMRAYQEALVLSKGDHVSFQSALTATAKAQEGMTTSLQRYGVQIAKGTPGQEQLTAIMKRWGDQADANTLDSDRLSAEWSNMQTTLGKALLPAFLKFCEAMDDTIQYLQTAADWVNKNQAIVLPFAAAIGAVVVALGLWKAATGAWTMATELATGAQEALNVAMEANPIGIVIVALVALGAALTVLYMKSQTFRDIVNGTWQTLKADTVAVFDAIRTTIQTAWDAIKLATTTVVQFIQDHWRAGVIALATILLGPLGTIVAVLATHWDTVKADATAAWNAVTGAVTTAVNTVRSTVTSAFNAVESAVSGAVDRVKADVSGVFNALGGIVEAAVGAVKAGVGDLEAAFSPITTVLQDIVSGADDAANAIDAVVSAAGKVSSLGGLAGKVGGFLTGHFATGTSDAPGGLALVGENGPEIVNLPGGSQVFTNGQSRRMLAGAGGGSGVTIQGDLVIRENMDVDRAVSMMGRKIAAAGL